MIFGFAVIPPDTVSVLFSLDELWIIREAVRHEVDGQDRWLFPPAGLELNDQVADQILFCVEKKEIEAPLLLSRGDCLILDFCVNLTMKDKDGLSLGKSILIKSFAARRDLRDGALETGTEPSAPSVSEIKAALQERKED
jgi:hypothetical protein